MVEVREGLIEVGFAALILLQPDRIDVEEVSRRFGSRTCLPGTIPCQKILPSGTPADAGPKNTGVYRAVGK